MTLQVSLVALNAYPAIDATVKGPIGGIETRSWLFARGLAQQPDCNVEFLVRHVSPLQLTQAEGVKVRGMIDTTYALRESLSLRLQRKSTFPFVTLKEKRLSDSWLLPLIALRKAFFPLAHQSALKRFLMQGTADVFVTFGVQTNSAVVIETAKERNAASVLFLGSDGDLDPRYYLSDIPFVNSYGDSSDLCRRIIQQADVVICQTEQQRKMLQAFGRDGVVISNPIDLEVWDAVFETPTATSEQLFTGFPENFALWIGRAENVHKRPVDLISLAKLTPNVPYVMVLNRRDDEVERQVRESAPANVHIIRQVPFSLMPALFRRAKVLVNTSSLEGFPNTFLQAMASLIPVASLNVEQQFLEQSQAGICTTGDIARLAQVAESFWNLENSEAEQQRRLHARSYVEQHHSLTAQSEKLFQVLLQSSRYRGR